MTNKDDNVTVPPRRIESSNAIQILTPIRKIWRGNVWSEFKVKIIIDQYFLKNGESHEAKYCLHTYLENCVSRVKHMVDSNSLNLKFERGNPKDRSSTVVELDSYNELYVKIHQDLFVASDEFRIIVEAQSIGNIHQETITFGASQAISVTDLSLIIENKFMESRHSIVVEDNIHAWYSKCGAEDSGLDVVFHLYEINNDGQIVLSKAKVPIQLHTELVYEDGTTTPFQPLCPLKERRSDKVSEKPLYRKLIADPFIPIGDSSVPFSFRVEEVSFHHSSYNGFKLKVGTSSPNLNNIYPAITKETIVVLSKPKPKKRTFDEIGIKRVQGDFFTESQNNSIIKRRRVTVEESNGLVAAIPSRSLVESYCCNGECFCCKVKILVTDFLRERSHKSSCEFISQIFPLLQFENQCKDQQYIITPKKDTHKPLTPSINVSPIQWKKKAMKIKVEDEDIHPASFKYNQNHVTSGWHPQDGYDIRTRCGYTWNESEIRSQSYESHNIYNDKVSRNELLRPNTFDNTRIVITDEFDDDKCKFFPV